MEITVKYKRKYLLAGLGLWECLLIRRMSKMKHARDIYSNMKRSY